DHQEGRSPCRELLMPVSEVEVEELHLRGELGGQVLRQGPDNRNRKARHGRGRGLRLLDRGRRHARDLAAAVGRWPLGGLRSRQRLGTFHQRSDNRVWKCKHVERIATDLPELCSEQPPSTLTQ